MVSFAMTPAERKSHADERASVLASLSMKETWRRYTINPRTSKWLPVWDTVGAFALMFTAIVTIYEVAFLPSGLVALFVVNRLVDVVFIIDLVIQFFLQFPLGSDEDQGGAHWVTDLPSISKHYLKGWFALDFFTTIVLVFDIIAFVEEGSSTLGKLKSLRVLRVLRLIKLLRLLRGSRLLNRWETRLSIDYGMLSLVQSVFGVLIASHWGACIWMLQTAFADDLEETWVFDKGYCVQTPSDAPQALLDKYSAIPPTADAGYGCMEHSAMYSACIYFSTMTITSIGYGDISATPQNSTEQIIATIIMLLGGVIWSQVIGTFCGVIATMNPAQTDFRLTISALNGYMHANHLPAEMSQRVRDYFHRTRHLWTSNASREVLLKMSPALQGEVLLHANRAWLHHVPWLLGENPTFIAEIALAMRPAVFAPKERVLGAGLHVVHSGIAIHGGRILRHGGVWGSDCLLAAAHLRSRTTTRSITYLEIFFVLRDEVHNIAEKFGETQLRLRRRTRRMALQRFIVLLSKASRHLRYVEKMKAKKLAEDAGELDKMDTTSKQGRKAKFGALLKRASTCAKFVDTMNSQADLVGPDYSSVSHGSPEYERAVEAKREAELNACLFRLASMASGPEPDATQNSRAAAGACPSSGASAPALNGAPPPLVMHDRTSPEKGSQAKLADVAHPPRPAVVRQKMSAGKRLAAAASAETSQHLRSRVDDLANSVGSMREELGELNTTVSHLSMSVNHQLAQIARALQLRPGGPPAAPSSGAPLARGASPTEAAHPKFQRSMTTALDVLETAAVAEAAADDAETNAIFEA